MKIYSEYRAIATYKKRIKIRETWFEQTEIQALVLKWSKTINKHGFRNLLQEPDNVNVSRPGSADGCRFGYAHRV